MTKNASDLVAFISNVVMADKSLDDIQTLRAYISRNQDDKESAFCDWLDLGSWFYDSLVVNDIDVESLLDEVEAAIEAEIKEAQEDRAEVEDEYRRSQGWPV